jgi:hypothetical protein
MSPPFHDHDEDEGRAHRRRCALRGMAVTAMVTVMVLWVLFVTGCATGAAKPKATPARATVNPAPAIKAQEKKDETVVAAAVRIEDANAAAPDSPQKELIAEEVVVVKEAIAAAPAADVAKLVADYAANAKADAAELTTARKAGEEKDRIIAAKEKEITDLKNETLRRTAWTIVLVSLGIIGISAVAIALSPNKLSALMSAGPAALVGVLGLGLAQIVAQPWFKWACGGVLLVATAAGIWWMVRQHQKGQLDKALLEKAALAEGTLGKLVPAIDDTIKHARTAAQNEGEALLNSLIAKLSGKMDAKEKALIHKVRATIQAS